MESQENDSATRMIGINFYDNFNDQNSSNSDKQMERNVMDRSETLILNHQTNQHYEEVAPPLQSQYSQEQNDHERDIPSYRSDFASNKPGISQRETINNPGSSILVDQVYRTNPVNKNNLPMQLDDGYKNASKLQESADVIELSERQRNFDIVRRAQTTPAAVTIVDQTENPYRHPEGHDTVLQGSQLSQQPELEMAELDKSRKQDKVENDININESLRDVNLPTVTKTSFEKSSSQKKKQLRLLKQGESRTEQNLQLMKQQSSVGKKEFEKKYDTAFDQPLTVGEIEEAEIRIQALYPFQEVPIRHLFPSLQKFWRYCCVCFHKKYQRRSKIHSAEEIARINTVDREEMINSQLEKGILNIKRSFKRNQSIRKKMKLPEALEKQLKYDSQMLDEIIKGSGKTYKGTDPVEDYKNMYAEKQRIRLEATEKYDDNNDNGRLEQHDPFEPYGYGIKAYFELMFFFAMVFLVFSVLYIPIVYVYYQGETMDFSTRQFSLGNLGQADAICAHQYVGLNKETSYRCLKGKISKLSHAGFLPDKTENIGAIKRLITYQFWENDFCGDSSIFPKIDYCSKEYADLTQLEIDFNLECQGKEDCVFNMIKYVKKAEFEDHSSHNRRLQTSSDTPQDDPKDVQTVELENIAEGKSNKTEGSYEDRALVNEEEKTESKPALPSQNVTQIVKQDLIDAQIEPENQNDSNDDKSTNDVLNNNGSVEINSNDEAKNDQNNQSFIEGKQNLTDRDVSQDKKATSWDCVDAHSQMYIQYSCDLSDDVKSQQKAGLLVGTLSTICGLALVFILYYLKRLHTIQKDVFDLQTCTSADYTVRIDIPQELWNKWVEKNKHKKGSFKKYFKEKIEEQLKKKQVVFTTKKKNSNDEQKYRQDQTHIANITFAYDNRKLINYLTERGTQVSQGKFAEVIEIENKIAKEIDLNQAKIIRPVASFITFETQEAKERCVKYFSFREDSIQGILCARVRDERFKILGEQLNVQTVPEPSNLVWENISQPRKSIIYKSIAVVLSIGAFMIFILILFAYLKGLLVSKYKGFNPGNDCKPTEELFKGLDPEQKKATHLKYAQFSKLDMIQSGKTSDVYQCFCKEYDTVFQPQKICNDYRWIQGTRLFYKYGVAIPIAIVNLLIRIFNVKVIQWIGFDLKTQEINMIVISIFIAQYFNTGIILLLTNADFENGSFLVFLGDLFQGSFSDFTTRWYLQVSPAIVTTMMIKAVSPQMNFAVSIGINFLLRFIDSGFRCCLKKHSTKKKSINEFVKLYSGPDLEIWFRYATMLNLVFVTFTHGIAMPILFPIGFFGMLNQYFFETVLLARYYKQPPEFDGRLNKLTLNTMRSAPVIMMAFGYWYLGNRQMFFNQMVSKVNNSDSTKVDHYPSQFIESLQKGQVDHTMPILIFFLIMLFQTPYIKLLTSIFTRCKLFQDPKEFSKLSAYDSEALLVDENLPKYWNGLAGMAQKRWYARELYNREYLGFQTIDDSAFHKLSTKIRKHKVLVTKCNKDGKPELNTLGEPIQEEKTNKFITNTANYDILSNQIYVDKFFFTHLDQRNKFEENSHFSDYIIRILNWGEDEYIDDQNHTNTLLQDLKAQILKEKTEFQALAEKMKGNFHRQHSDQLNFWAEIRMREILDEQEALSNDDFDMDKELLDDQDQNEISSDGSQEQGPLNQQGQSRNPGVKPSSMESHQSVLSK